MSSIPIWSCEVSAWNLFGDGTKSKPVSFDISATTFSSKPSGVLRPVPTAVPPIASSAHV